MTEFVITQAWIEEFQTEKGSWTYDQLRAAGVEIPPTHGWMRRIIGTKITEEARKRFEMRMRKGAAKAFDRGPDYKPAVRSTKAERKAERRAARKIAKLGRRSALDTTIVRPRKIDKDYREFYNTPEWRRLRYRAFLVLGRACQCCFALGTLGKPLHVDHIKPRYYFPKLELELSNLQILCEDCNLGKGAWDETDWRTDEQKEHMQSIMRE